MAQPADVLFGSSFPQLSEQLQHETLGHLIFPPSDPNPCLLHRDFLTGHSWGHIWTETGRSHPQEGTADVEERCVPGAVPQPGWGPGTWSLCPESPGWGRSGKGRAEMLREGKALAKTSQTPPDLPYHGGPLHLEHRVSNTNIRGTFSPIFPPLPPRSFKSPWVQAQVASSFTPSGPCCNVLLRSVPRHWCVSPCCPPPLGAMGPLGRSCSETAGSAALPLPSPPHLPLRHRVHDLACTGGL